MFSALMLLVSPVLAGGWTQPTGAHYLKVSQRTLVGSSGFAPDGSVFVLPNGGRYFDVTLNIYGELGVTDDWTVLVSTTPLGRSHVLLIDDPEQEGVTGWYSGTSLIGARRRLSDGAVKLAAEGRVGGAPPFGTARLAWDQSTPWLWETNTPTAQAEAELQAGVGLSRGWVTASAGGRWQSADELPALSVLGALGAGWSTKGQRLTVSLLLSTIQPLETVVLPNVAGTGATRYVGYEPGLSVRLGERLSLVGSIGGVVAAQANAATPALNLGLEHR